MRLWESGSGSQLALYPNLNANDEDWRKLMRDVRFRRALSVAIDRGELNEAVYLGLAKPSNNTIMERSELFKPEYATRWGGIRSRGGQSSFSTRLASPDATRTGIRLLPDGRAALIVVESQSEMTEDADTLQLIADSWKKIGIKMLVKLQTLENFWPAPGPGWSNG
ncbi:ABC transporter substrate-binding protein [Levilactobacillus brevis]